METGHNHKLAVELTYPLRRVGLQQMNQLQQTALLVGALTCAKLGDVGVEQTCGRMERGGCWRKGADAARPDAE